jgi:hypothetical protein
VGLDGNPSEVGDVRFHMRAKPVVRARAEHGLVGAFELAEYSGCDVGGVDDAERVLEDPERDARAVAPSGLAALALVAHVEARGLAPHERAVHVEERGAGHRSAEPIPAHERLREQVAERVKRDGRADAAGTGAEPAEDERGKEDGEPSGVVDGRDVTEGEDGARDDDGGADRSPEQAPARRPCVFEATLHVAAIERLFGERHDEELRGELVGEVGGTRSEKTKGCRTCQTH